MSSKTKRDLSFPSLPDVLFVVELDQYVLLTGFQITECIFPYYKFDKTSEAAYEAAEDIAVKSNKLVVNAVDFYIHDPLIYDPKKIQEQVKNLVKVITEAREKIAKGEQS